MSLFEVETSEGVAVVWLDGADRVNKLSRGMLESFATLLDELEQDPGVRAAVLISRKPDSFVVGADIEEFAHYRDAAEVEAVIGRAHALLSQLENLTKPVLAAIHGACMGGGLELALACHYRLATRHPKTRFALPEVKLGLLPGAGGTQRLPRLIGLQQGLELLLTGKSVYADRAQRIGLIDATIHPPGLLPAARQAALMLAAGALSRKKPKRRPLARLLEETPLEHLVYRRAEAQVRSRTFGHYPAPPKILQCVRAGREQGMRAGLAAEAASFAELLFTPQSRALVHLFFAERAHRKNPFSGARQVRTLGVLGAGLMGAGIAQVGVAADYDVRLKDASLELTARGMAAVHRGLSRRIGKGSSAFERDRQMARLVPVTDYAQLAATELVIEAVPEDLQLKRQVLAEVEAVTNRDLVYASNTSSLPIGDIAAASARPAQVVGMHYFSPVPKMPLLELVRTDVASEAALATAYEVARAQGKTVIVVRDGPGFYTTRILARYLDEAMRLLSEGTPVAAVDSTMRAFGFPVGPLALLDEVGIDVGAKIGAAMEDFFRARGLEPHAADQRLADAGLTGRKGGRGFYVYGDGKKQPNPDIGHLLAAGTRAAPSPEIQERLVLAMVGEALACLGEGVLASAASGDVGAVFGLGFPPFLGGPFWHTDAQGASRMLARFRACEARHGSRFAPPPLLVEQADTGASFYAQPPEATPAA